MGTAKCVVSHLEGFNGRAALYKVDPAVEYDAGHFGVDKEGGTTEYVVVSSVVAPFTGPETLIFPADEVGNVINWSDLPGSYRGGMSHAEALDKAGYDIA